MVDNEEAAPRLSAHAREVLRLMRMFGAKPDQVVRVGVLRNLWARHVPRAEVEDLSLAIQELTSGGQLARGTPDGVVFTEKGLAAR